MNNQEIMKQVDDEIEKIEKAVEHLENGGHIKCSIPECGDVSCASAVVYNAISVARIQTNLIIAQSLAQKDKEREEVVREIVEELERWKGDGLIGTRGDLYSDFAQQLREKYAIKKD